MIGLRRNNGSAPGATPAAAPLLTPGIAPPDVLRRLPRMTREEIDALDFSVIQVDDEGVILLYSRRESDLTGFDVKAVEGTNFFTELAPCVNNGLVYGRFQEGIAAGALDSELNYALTYRMRPVLAQLRLWRDPETGTNWVLLKRIGVFEK